jgi:dienelactone hydrolase
MRGWGYATLIVDSFTARGYPNGICSNSNSVNGLDRSLDLYSAAAVLARTSNVNPQKIGVFGSSHGGSAAEITATANRSNTQSAFNALNAAGGKISALASLYPVCDAIGGTTYYSPLFVAAAADDNWNSPATCKSLTNYPAVANTPVDLNAYGALLRIIVYQNATHSFDIPGSTKVVTDSSGHTFAYNATATADLHSRLRTFFDTFLH